MTDRSGQALRTAELRVPDLGDGDSRGTWDLQFAFKDTVDSHGSLMPPVAFPVDQAVALTRNHDWGKETVGIGRIYIDEKDGEYAGIRGTWHQTNRAQQARREIWDLQQGGLVPEVSIGMDWRTWTIRDHDELTERELALGATWAIDKVERCIEVSLVLAGSVPGTSITTRSEALDTEPIDRATLIEDVSAIALADAERARVKDLIDA